MLHELRIARDHEIVEGWPRRIREIERQLFHGKAAPALETPLNGGKSYTVESAMVCTRSNMRAARRPRYARVYLNAQLPQLQRAPDGRSQ
jgi:hypothetical protein